LIPHCFRTADRISRRGIFKSQPLPHSSRRAGGNPNIDALKLIPSLINAESLLKRKGKHLPGCMQFALRLLLDRNDKAYPQDTVSGGERKMRRAPVLEGLFLSCMRYHQQQHIAKYFKKLPSAEWCAYGALSLSPSAHPYRMHLQRCIVSVTMETATFPRCTLAPASIQ
jgi:hypothetical protein